MAQQTMYPAIANSPGTELSAAITAAVTTIPVVNAAALPAAPNIATIGVDETAETVLYTGKSGNSLTGCTRGHGGTTARSWVVASKVARYFTAYDHDTFRANILDLIDFLAYMPINGGTFDGDDPIGPVIDGGTY
ncbi:hypothetical protein [Paenibacillus graminis]|uniref:hypothetical protein n=1 Tax=Paenibacillus graminis TaxID=189425 RepID=UPI002DB68877|nr:hypothetical protein [Paenibacillus graminis]MEC0167852.1 hypothetical protein [Paenibacillus graminis]